MKLTNDAGGTLELTFDEVTGDCIGTRATGARGPIHLSPKGVGAIELRLRDQAENDAAPSWRLEGIVASESGGSFDCPVATLRRGKTSNHLRVSVSEFPVTPAPPWVVAPHHHQFTLGTGSFVLELEVSKSDLRAVELQLPRDATTALCFDVFLEAARGKQSILVGIPLRRGDGTRPVVAVNLQSLADDAPFIAWAFPTAGAPARVRFSFIEDPGKWGASVASEQVLTLEGFGGRSILAEVAEAVVESCALRIPPGAVTLDSGTLHLPVELLLRLAGEEALATGGSLEFDSRLVLAGGLGATRIQGSLQREIFLMTGDGSLPLSLHLHRGTQWIVNLDPRDLFVALQAGDTPAASVYLPALRTKPAKAGDLESMLAERFVLDVPGEDPHPESDSPATTRHRPCRFGPGGVRLTAEARPTTITLGGGMLENVQLHQARLEVDRGEFDLELVAEGSLGYFEKATGRLGLRGSSRSKPPFAARFEPQLAAAWEDPTGTIEFREPRAAIQVSLRDSTWEVDGTLGGTLGFKRLPKWVGDAGEWLGEFFEQAALSFDGLRLRELLKSTENAVRLNLQSNSGAGLRLWRILEFDLTHLSLGLHGFEFGGDLRLNLAGGLRFAGSLPRLRIALERGVRIDLARGPLAFGGRLSTPAGLRARMDFVRESEETRERIAGRGSLSIPGWSDIGITCGFGRRLVTQGTGPGAPRKWIGLFFLFAEADIPIPLFPGVVLRQMGLGLGVNQALRGFKDLYAQPDGVLSLMNDERGLPDPTRATDWEDSGGFDQTDFSLVARTHIAPMAQGSGPFPYLAEALFYLQPTSDLCLAFTSNLWLFTGLDDVANDPEYRRRPVAQMVMVMYPRHGYLEARARTLRHPKMKAAAQPVADALGVFQAEFWLKATPDLFLLRVGEIRADLQVAGFSLHGSLLYAVRAASGQVLVLMRQELAGGFDLDWSIDFGAGPFHFSAGLAIHARMAYSVLLAGGYLPSLGFLFYGRLHVLVSVQLHVHLRVEFRLRIKIGWFRVTISWSFSVSASLSLCFEAELEAVVAQKDLALAGRGRLEFRVCGYGFSPSIDFHTGSSSALERARAGLQPLLPQLRSV